MYHTVIVFRNGIGQDSPFNHFVPHNTPPAPEHPKFCLRGIEIGNFGERSLFVHKLIHSNLSTRAHQARP